MTEQQLQVVENKYPNIDTKNQVEHWEYSIEGYNVAIFYTSEYSAQDRYINAILTETETGEYIYLEPIKMLKSFEIEPEEYEKTHHSKIDVQDLNNIYDAIADYLEFKRLEPIRRQCLARQAIRLENERNSQLLFVQAA